MNQSKLWMAVYVQAVIAFAQSESMRDACESAAELADAAVAKAIEEGQIE